MMKATFLLLSFLLLVFATEAQKSSGQSGYVQAMSDTDTLRLSYIGGDEGYNSFGILIFKFGESFFAERHGDPLFVGKQREPVWRKKLNRKHIRMTNRYIDELKTNQECAGTSSVYENISASINDDTIAQFKGYCWFGFPIEDQLFKGEYEHLKVKRKRYTDRLSSIIEGIHFPGAVRTDSTWKYLYLFRQYQPEKSYSLDCIWEFSSPNQFKSLCTIFDMQYSRSYEWLISDGSIRLRISPGVLKNDKGHLEIANEGAEYEIVKITPEFIVLKNPFDH